MKRGVFFLSVLLGFLNRAGTTLSLEDIGILVRDLPRHNSFQYLTRFSLPAEYFEAAYGALEDPHIYIILSDTGSPAGKVIGFFTASPYNHLSLSFDPALKTLVSYNGGNGISSPGLNRERPEHLNLKPGASLAVYRLKTREGKKRAVIDRLAAINREGSSYNLLGLLTGKSILPNIMFCSQFVYTVLRDAGVVYFNKKGGILRPVDFVNLARGDGLEFTSKIDITPCTAGTIPEGKNFPITLDSRSITAYNLIQ
ncbi:MAG: hypothetical protein LBC60_01125 [Spirochaetaceae bacterium]|jgi:hypothetical protein|nr:hypothetical protein [Spirochaetaceae bacterium]